MRKTLIGFMLAVCCGGASLAQTNFLKANTALRLHLPQAILPANRFDETRSCRCRLRHELGPSPRVQARRTERTFLP